MDQPTATNPDPNVVKTTKTYYARTPGMRYVFQDGFEVYFLGPAGRAVLELADNLGSYIVKNGQEIFVPYHTELDKIIGRQPQIFVDDANPQLEPLPDTSDMVRAPVSEGQLAAANAALTGMNVVTQQDTVLTPDADIQNALANATAAADSQLISQADQARAAALARIAARGQTPV